MKLRGGYFHTVGHTEVDGLPGFLRKLHPEIEWERCFPSRGTLAPRPVRSDRADPNRPRQGPGTDGMTGARLVEEMLQRLRAYKRGPNCDLDVVLLVDDADCRFHCSSDCRAHGPGDCLSLGADDRDARYKEWVAKLSAEVREATGKKDLVFCAMLAFPEVEAWFVADWRNGFGRTFRGLSEALHEHVKRCLLSPLTWERVGEFGGALKNGSCEHKLSEQLQAAFVQPASACQCKPPLLQAVAALPEDVPRRYSKKNDGADMLKRIEPEVVARFSPRFRAAWDQLQRLKPRSPDSPPPRA